MHFGYALIGSTVSAASGGLALTATQFASTGDDPSTIFTQAGVFSIVIAVGYWLLTRNDKREDKARLESQKQIADLRVDFEARIGLERAEAQARENEMKTQNDLRERSLRQEVADERAKREATEMKLAEALVKIANLEGRLNPH